MNKIAVSINTNFADKQTSDKKYFKDGFDAYELKPQELADAIHAGYAYSYQFLRNQRNTQNFIRTGFICVDVDYGFTIGEAMETGIVRSYCTILHKTASHTPDHHRFRLIFQLPRNLDNSSDVRYASRSLVRRLGGDPKTTDPGRMFYGCKDSYPEILGNSISSDFLEELIRDGKTPPKSETTTFAGHTASRSAFEPDASLVVKTSDGSQVTVSSLVSPTSIHCPFHNDSNPSAFLSMASNGSKYIHCSSCQQTWFLKGTKPYEVNFDGFVEALRNTRVDSEAKGTLLPWLDVDQMLPDDVKFMTSMHIRLDRIDDGLTLIKSPKGSGKTTYLVNAIDSIINKYKSLEDYENAAVNEGEDSFYSNQKVLLIGHRKALIGELCQRLKLNCYLDDDPEEYGLSTYRKRRYGVCLDSLHRVMHQSYDVILIDEVEQVLGHFLSDTLGENRRGLFNLLGSLLSKAKKVVALDADLGWVSYITLTHLVRSGVMDVSVQKKAPRVRVYINEYKPKARSLDLYSSAFQLVREIERQIVEGKRVFVTSNSKTKIKALTKSIEHLSSRIGREISIISVTSENSSTKEVQEFIKNIKTEILKYQVVLSSPSLGTGIDITFDAGSQEIDAVFGLFENLINSHFEIDQQLARVRNPKSVHVWVSPRKFDFETEFRVVAKDFLHRHLLDTFQSGYLSASFDPSTQDIDSFLKMAALIVSNQRASKNQLRENFIQYRKDQNWIVNMVAPDENMIDEGRELYKIGRDISDQEMVRSIVNAPQIDRETYEQIMDLYESNEGHDQVVPQEWFSCHRFRLEDFYHRPISADLVIEDDHGKFRRQVVMYEKVIALKVKGATSELAARKIAGDTNKQLTNKLFKDGWTGAGLLRDLFSKTPIFDGEAFLPDVELQSDDLTAFAKKSKTLKGLVETQLEVMTQSDVEVKAVQHLNKLLATVGLGTVKTRVTNRGGAKIYIYKLDQSKLDHIQSIVYVRSKAKQSNPI